MAKKIGAALGSLVRGSPLIRALILIFFVALVFLFFALFSNTVKKKPIITAIQPPIGSPGDVIVITGENFGSSRAESFVEIAGSRITASGYSEWTNTQISIILPLNVQDGLVTVQTKSGTSEPAFFANKTDLPVIIRTDPRTTRPSVIKISPDTISIGKTLTISGSNFGNSRGKSKVLFKTQQKNTEDEPFIAANDAQYDYEYWSDTEIRVRVPDGTTEGILYIETDKGRSTEQNFGLNFPIGQKVFTGERTYVVQLSADIQSRDTEKNQLITIYIPRPALSAMQPSVTVNEVVPEPLIKDDPYNIIQQFSPTLAEKGKQRFTQSYIVNVRSVQSQIKANLVSNYKDKSRLLYTAYTSPDSCVPSESAEIISLASQFTADPKKNPYQKALSVYNYMLDTYKLLPNTRTGNISPLDLLDEKIGDSYDFAIVFTALCRAIGIPAVPVSGVLVESNSATKNHWWSEIYFEDYGWFPVDVAIGAGFAQKMGIELQGEQLRAFYFGSLDAQHITFSRGYKEIKPSFANGHTVLLERTYALQSIWEESNNVLAGYSSLWNAPVITGIY